MTDPKINVAVLFGGRSPEHHISLLSARSVIDNLDKQKYLCHLVGIDKSGIWRYYGDHIVFVNEGDPTKIQLPTTGSEVLLSASGGDHGLYYKGTGTKVAAIDVVFPVLHGLHGEDGSVQGLAKMAQLPLVGCGILGSAICMDKDVAKRLLRDSGIAVADFVTVRKGDQHKPTYASVSAQLGSELYIKPVNLGSSVGVSMVDNEQSYREAMNLAFRYDRKVIVEEKIEGREIECAILGNDAPQASVIGEIRPTSEFYTFESKYVDKDDAKLSIPADISADASEKARELAVRAFTLLECRGFARVDMFLTADDQLVVNEINTIPGFTSISMYPKLWQYGGLAYAELLSRLIDLATEHQTQQNALMG